MGKLASNGSRKQSSGDLSGCCVLQSNTVVGEKLHQFFTCLSLYCASVVCGLQFVSALTARSRRQQWRCVYAEKTFKRCKDQRSKGITTCH